MSELLRKLQYKQGEIVNVVASPAEIKEELVK